MKHAATEYVVEAYRPRIGAFIFAVTAFLTGVSLPYGLALSLTQQAGTADNRALALITITYAAAHLSLMLFLGEPRLIRGILWFFIYVTFGIVPIAQMTTGQLENLIATDTLTRAQVLVLVAMLCFDLGQLFGRGTLRRRPIAIPDHGVGRGRLWILSVFALVASAYYVKRLGGIGVLFQTREEVNSYIAQVGLTDSGQSSLAIIQAAGQVPPLIAFAAWTYILFGSRQPRQPSHVLCWVTLLGVNVIVNNPISNSRYWFLTVLIGLVYAIPRFSRNLYRLSLVVAPLAAIFVFPYADYYRKPAEDRLLVKKDTLSLIASKDYDQWVMTANGIWWTGVHGLQTGFQQLTVLLFALPRSAWPGKGLDTGVLIGKEIPGAGTTNLSSPLWIEIFVDFGWVGVIVEFILLGILVQRLDARFARLRNLVLETPTVSQIVLPFIAAYSLILLRGPLLQATGKLVVMVGVGLFLSARRPGGEDPTDLVGVHRAPVRLSRVPEPTTKRASLRGSPALGQLARKKSVAPLYGAAPP